MFIYFDSKGVLKEIVNDEAIRQGDSNGQIIIDGVVQPSSATPVDAIYFFIEGSDPEFAEDDDGKYYKAISFLKGLRTFYDRNGEQVDAEEEFSISTVKSKIPYDPKRELKFFKYWQRYELFKIPISDDVLNESGTFACSIKMVNYDLTQKVLGLLVFNIEMVSNKPKIRPDTAINVAQWNYLISNMITITDLDNNQFKQMVGRIIREYTDSELDDESENPVQNKVVTEALNGKVSKTDSQSVVYGTNASGEQIYIEYSDDTTSNAIVKRSGSQVKVPQAPVTDTDATSKHYVDNLQISTADIDALFD